MATVTVSGTLDISYIQILKGRYLFSIESHKCNVSYFVLTMMLVDDDRNVFSVVLSKDKLLRLDILAHYTILELDISDLLLLALGMS